tara:strand:+ start:839 stop:1498 length:660 start_codon:yes stop_codon:yes gene_type:complete
MKIQVESNLKKFSLLTFRTSLFLIGSIIFPFSPSIKVHAEPESFLPAEMIAAPGETKNNSLTSGSRAVLSFGTSTNFGSNANVTGSSGYNVNVKAEMKPRAGKFTSSYGEGADAGVITATVGNIRSAGTGSFSGDNFSVESDDTSAAEGSANMTGVKTSIDFNFDEQSITSVAITPKGNLPEGDETLHTANGSANNSSNNTIDVNVSTSEFQNAFSQAF